MVAVGFRKISQTFLPALLAPCDKNRTTASRNKPFTNEKRARTGWFVPVGLFS